MSAGTQTLGPSSTASQVHCWGTEVEMEQLGLKPMLLYDAGPACGGFACCAVALTTNPAAFK